MTDDEFVVDWLTKVKNDWRDTSRKPFIGSDAYMRKSDAVEDYLRQGRDPKKVHDGNIGHVIEALQQDLMQLSGTVAEQRRWQLARYMEIAKLEYEKFTRSINKCSSRYEKNGSDLEHGGSC